MKGGGRCAKAAWTTKAKAEAFLARVARDPHRTRVIPTRAYRCDEGPDACGLWHVTARPTWSPGAKVLRRPTDT